MVEIKGKVFKSGTSYAIRIPKALIDCKILELERTYKATIEKVESIILE